MCRVLPNPGGVNPGGPISGKGDFLSKSHSNFCPDMPPKFSHWRRSLAKSQRKLHYSLTHQAYGFECFCLYVSLSLALSLSLSQSLNLSLSLCLSLSLSLYIRLDISCWWLPAAVLLSLSSSHCNFFPVAFALPLLLSVSLSISLSFFFFLLSLSICSKQPSSKPPPPPGNPPPPWIFNNLLAPRTPPSPSPSRKN